jgi:hypothetical protein
MEPQVGMSFSSEAEAYSFYNKYYAENVGFSKKAVSIM